MNTIDFEKSRYMREIGDTYFRAVALLDKRLQNGQVTQEESMKRFKFEWRTMLYRQRALAETYSL